MDRRTIWAIILMMVIAILPALFLERPARAPVSRAAEPRNAGAPSGPAHSPPGAPALRAPLSSADSGVVSDSGAPAAPVVAAPDTVRVTSPLYTYAFSTVGGRMVEATLPRYRSMAGEQRGAAQIVPLNSELLALSLVVGRDTVSLRDWVFTPSADSLAVDRPSALRLTATRGAVSVDLSYSFRPDEYQVGVTGRVRGVGPNGGLLLVGMGPSLANTEVDSADNARALALVTKHNDTERMDFSSLEPGLSTTLNGPFEWAAVKSKYFVTGLLADSATGGISGITATAPANAGKDPAEAIIRLSLPVPATGNFGYTLYAGPMEYERLARLGNEFDDVNPYGWPGFRTVIRAIAVPVRWLLVWMHENLYLAYGVVLIVFGILVRVILWPLNQKAMRASMQMQVVQPLLKDIQERYKSDPQRMQQEMFKLYREHGVNPLGGCWPMLLPMPVFLALFFVFQNAIELRGTSFLWVPDLSRPDPLYIIPLLMGGSMYVMTKIGQQGMEPNPQARMMLYMMPAMMTVMFLWFPSGLNLYYAVSNIASIPQQWLLARERKKRAARAIVDVKTAPEPKAPRPPKLPKQQKKKV
jgi:YidC/Oxa1 family membrane protein insertase